MRTPNRGRRRGPARASEGSSARKAVEPQGYNGRAIQYKYEPQDVARDRRGVGRTGEKARASTVQR